MKLDTAINKQIEYKKRVCDLFSSAKTFKWSANELTKHYIEDVLNPLQEKKAPQWLIYFIKGYFEAKHDALWQEMEFCYLVDGKWYSTHKDSNKPRWDTLPNYNMKGKECCHMWKGTEKPYTEITKA